jgi:hypothetical protein
MRFARFRLLFGAALSRVGKYLFSVSSRQHWLCAHAGKIWGLGADPLYPTPKALKICFLLVFVNVGIYGVSVPFDEMG